MASFSGQEYASTLNEGWSQEFFSENLRTEAPLINEEAAVGAMNSTTKQEAVVLGVNQNDWKELTSSKVDSKEEYTTLKTGSVELQVSYNFSPRTRHLYEVDRRTQGALYRPEVSPDVYFLVHTQPERTKPLELVLYRSAEDTTPLVSVPLKPLGDGKQFIAVKGEGIGEGTYFTYRDPETGKEAFDPYTYNITKFAWKKMPEPHEVLSYKHYDPVKSQVMEDPIESYKRLHPGFELTPAPRHEDLKIVKFHPDLTKHLTDEQLGVGFEGTQGTLKALQSPYVQEHLLKRHDPSGFNQIELFPLHSLATSIPTYFESGTFNPDARNVWGYMQLSHWAIEQSYVHNTAHPWHEFIETIDALHKAGFRVSVDMPPHTFESEASRPGVIGGPDLSFRILDHEGYYATYPDGHRKGEPRNFSGCGNAFRGTPVPGRAYEARTLESQVSEGMAYYLRAVQFLHELGVDVRVDQGPIIGRNEHGYFNPQARALELMSINAHKFGSRVHLESGDCGRDGPGHSTDSIFIMPYAPYVPVNPESKLRSQDFFVRTVSRDALTDHRHSWGMPTLKAVADLMTNRGGSYAGPGIGESFRVVTVAIHDGKVPYDDLFERVTNPDFLNRHFQGERAPLLTNEEQKLSVEEQYRTVYRRLASTAALGVEFLTAFSPSDTRIWSYGTDVLNTQDFHHNAYDIPKYSSNAMLNLEDWRKDYQAHWGKKEALREELGVFAHRKFFPYQDDRWFDATGQKMNRGSHQENEHRWNNTYDRQYLARWYDGKEFGKPDVLVAWSSAPRRFDYEHATLPDPGKTPTGESYYWLRRADSSAFVVPQDKSWKKEVYACELFTGGDKISFQMSGVQVFQRVTEKDLLRMFGH